MGEETGELLTSKSPAPSTTSAAAVTTAKDLNSELGKGPGRRNREEGELTSSDEDAHPVRNGGPLSKAPVNVSCSVRAAQVKANTLHAMSGNIISLKHPTGYADVPPVLPIKSGHGRGFLKNQGPFTSSTPGWTPYGSNNDLVIRFSDDDDDESGSDADKRRRVEVLQSHSNPFVVNKHKSLHHLTPPKLDTRRTAQNERKMQPRKDSIGRVSFPLLKEVGRPSSKGAASFLPGLLSYPKNPNSAYRSAANQDHECGHSMVVNDSKLQDLRQKIAIRENELKLKAVQMKETSSDPPRNHGVTKQANSVLKKSCLISDDVEDGHEESERKRLKVAHSNSGQQPSSVGLRKQPLISVLSTKGQALEKSITVARSMEDLGHQDTEVPQKEPVLGYVGAQIGEEGCSLSAPICRRREALIMFNPNPSLPNSSLQDLETVSVSPGNTSPLPFSSRQVIQGTVDMDFQTLLAIEGLNDKELEEAQGYRRLCEIEENNALKAYRKAQRAVAEANARCILLYHRRESYAAKIRPFLVEAGCNLPWSRQHGQTEEEWNFLANPVAERDLIPTSNHTFQAKFDADNQIHHDSNTRGLYCEAQCRITSHVDGQNFGSEACSEPDASTSDLPQKSNAAAGLSPPSDPNISGDEGETFSFEQVMGETFMQDLRKETKFETKSKHVDTNSAMKYTNDDSQESLLLEAELRSKLVSRFGLIPSSRRNSEAERGNAKTAKSGFEADGTQTIQKDISLLPDVQASRSRGCEGAYRQKTSIQRAVEDDIGSLRAQMVANRHVADLGGFSSNPEDSVPSAICKASFDLSAPIIRSVFYQLKPTSRLGPNNMQLVDERNFHISSDDNIPTRDGIHEVVTRGLGGGIDTYTLGSAIHPFWPLCMYELRGKCNDEECPWQHSKDYSKTNFNQQDVSDNRDCQAGLFSNSSTPKDSIEILKVLTPPSYLISFDALGADSFLSGSAVARKIGPSCGNIFSTSLIVSSSLRRWLHSDELFLHGNDSCLEICGSYNRQDSFFQSRNSNMSCAGNVLADNQQSLEMALNVLSHDPNKAQGLKKSLAVLSRALEADPTSVGHWVVYLHLYYGDKHSIEKDDMFSSAVEHNEWSYELWLMYINSRKQLNDRFSAYERALTALCHYSSSLSCDEDIVCASVFILDVFLQMLYCYSLSGNVEKAIQSIFGLLDRDADGPCSLLFSDILSCLSHSDTFIFWASCAYLVIYKKLPDKLVQQFEYDKEMFLIEWPPVDIRSEDKQQVCKMLEMASLSIGHDESCKIFENRTARRSCHLFAVNLFKLVAAIGCTESCMNLLENCMKLHPSSLELVLLSLHARNSDSESMMFSGFEEALSNWTSKAGINCIWNQYAECALRNRMSDKARDIMVQWFNSVWKSQSSLDAVLDEDGDGKNGLSDPASVLISDGSVSHNNKTNETFGFINLSLYSLFDEDLLKAYSAIDKALMVSGPEDFRHCVREHASFWLNHGPKLGKDVSVNGLIGVLKTYLHQAHTSLNSIALTRRFIQEIRKPRLRQLVNDIFSPGSPDFSVVNLVLETWFGPSLLPQNLSNLKDLVDFVESILELTPSNYPLALAVCKLFANDSDDVCSRSPSTLFWASSLLTNTIYLAVPLAPEYACVEAASLLGNLPVVHEISDSFHRRALAAYPFSFALWRSFLVTFADDINRNYVIKSARERGIELQCTV